MTFLTEISQNLDAQTLHPLTRAKQRKAGVDVESKGLSNHMRHLMKHR